MEKILTKDTLIEGKIQPIGTKIVIEESVDKLEEEFDSNSMMMDAHKLIADAIADQDLAYVDYSKLGHAVGQSLGRAFWTAYRGDLSVVSLNEFLAGVAKGVN